MTRRCSLSAFRSVAQEAAGAPGAVWSVEAAVWALVPSWCPCCAVVASTCCFIARGASLSWHRNEGMVVLDACLGHTKAERSTLGNPSKTSKAVA